MATTALHTPLPADIRLMNATAAALAGIGAAALVALGVLWFVRQPMFALHTIRVEGDLTHNSALTIRANAAPRMAGNFFTMDLAATRRAFESVPWVRQALVRRVWPDKLVVRLEEHRPAALWSGTGPNDSTDRLVNTYGEVFEANLGDVEDESLPTLRGPDGASAHMLAMWAKLNAALAGLGADARVDTLELSGRGSWRAELDSGAEIEFGRGSDDELIERVQRFVGTVPQVTGPYQRPLEYADLRHHDGYAVRLKGVSTAAETGAKPAGR
jgi:cell division protein FtsQ